MISRRKASWIRIADQMRTMISADPQWYADEIETAFVEERRCRCAIEWKEMLYPFAAPRGASHAKPTNSASQSMHGPPFIVTLLSTSLCSSLTKIEHWEYETASRVSKVG